MDGTNGSTTFTDLSYAGADSPHTITSNGGAAINTSQSVFGGASGKFVAANSQYLSISDSADWYFTGDFTIDGWWRFNTLPSNGNNMGLVSQFVDGNDVLHFYVFNNAGTYLLVLRTVFGAGTGQNLVTGTFTVSTGTWYHLAVVRSGNIFSIYQGGTLVGGPNTNTTVFADLAAPLTINQMGYGGDYCDCWSDEVRVSNGVARWTSNFTPPTAAYTADAVVSGAGTSHGSIGKVISQAVHGSGLHASTRAVTFPHQTSAGIGTHHGSPSVLFPHQNVNGIGSHASSKGVTFPHQTGGGSGLSHASVTEKLSQIVAGSGSHVGSKTVKISQNVKGTGGLQTSVINRISQVVKGFGISSDSEAIKLSQSVKGIGLEQSSINLIFLHQAASGVGLSASSQATKLSQVVKGSGHNSNVAKTLLSQTAKGFGQAQDAVGVIISQMAHALGYGYSSSSLKTIISQRVNGAGQTTSSSSTQLNQIAHGTGSNTGHFSIIINQIARGLGLTTGYLSPQHYLTPVTLPSKSGTSMQPVNSYNPALPNKSGTSKLPNTSEVRKVVK